MVKVEQLYTGCLSQAAYFIMSNGEAAVVDPLRETGPYVALAVQYGVRIKYVLETHFHADFVSGHVDLAAASGATIVYGPTASPGFSAHVASDGEELRVGDATITVLHTPGHTMESVTYLLKDESGAGVCIFTGDTLFLGDVGRPDLAQRAASMTQEQLASLLYRSLREKIMPLSDALIVYPGHGAGSACGKNMSSDTQDTLGNQKRTNYALRPDMAEAEFVSELTTGLGAPPEYFAGNVAKNKKHDGVAFDELLRRGQRVLSVDEVAAALSVASGARPLVVDTREMDEYIGGHIPGSVWCGLSGGFAPWMSTAFPDLDRAIILVVGSDDKAVEAVTRLTRTGLDNVQGYLGGGVGAWVAAGRPVEKTLVMQPEELAARLDAKEVFTLVDVRRTGEVQHVRCEAALQLALGKANMERVPLGKEDVVVFCAAGYRALMCCSALIAERGHRGRVYTVAGGMMGMESCAAMAKHLAH